MASTPRRSTRRAVARIFKPSNPEQMALVEDQQADVGEQFGCERQQGEAAFRRDNREGWQGRKDILDGGVVNALRRCQPSDPLGKIAFDLADKRMRGREIENGLPRGDRRCNLQGGERSFPDRSATS